MGERVLAGAPASPGAAAAPALPLVPAAADPGARIAAPDRPAEAARARAALEAAAAELDALAAGHDGADAAILETGALLARDPGLTARVAELVAQEGSPAAAALLRAAEEQATVLAALPDAMLAERAADVRSVGRRAARHAAGARPGAGAGAPTASSGAGSTVAAADGAIVVADDLGPADVAELAAGAAGFALAGGGATAHAAILARSLGVPMVAGLGDAVLHVAAGEELVLDGDAGTVVLAAAPARAEAAREAAHARRRLRERDAADRDLPAETTDGRRVTVLANVAAAAEVRVALAAGAEGVGLLRTELAFLDALSWPDEAAHRRALAPVLAPLGGRPVTVRVLDFGADKTPPFLAREPRGIALLLAHEEALAAQLRAVRAEGAGVGLRVLLPLVERAEQVTRVRALLGDDVPLGAMVETPAAAEAVDAIAAAADVLSVGTNDLTAAVLGVDRFTAGAAPAHDPRVLRVVARTADAARAAGIPLEVCGEAASSPVAMPLLLGLGADELSVGASRVGTVRAWVRALDAADCRSLATAALQATTAQEVEDLAAATAQRLAVLERGDDRDERVDRGRGVVALGPQA